MDKVNFSEREKLIPVDVNDLHNLTENALANLIRSISGDAEDILFKDAPPLASHVPPNIRIDVPEQWFAVQGIPGEIAAETILKPDVADYHKLYFIVTRNDQSADRDFVELSPIHVVTHGTVIRKTISTRIEVLSSGNHTVPPGTPTLNPNDIGFVEYASVIWDGAILTVNHNITAVYSFPGSAASVGAHGTTHLPGGVDEVPAAAMGGDPSGSTGGLMPIGALAVVDAALQLIEISDLSKCLTKTISGDNTPGNPKKAEIRLRVNNSLKGFDVGADTFLGLSFVAGAYSGVGEQPARSDHTHPPSQSPVAVIRYHTTLGSGDLGTLIDVPKIAGVSRIYTTQVFWAPPGAVSPPYPMVDCGWLMVGSYTVGVRAHIVATDEVKLEVGGQAFASIGSALMALFPTPNWTYGSLGVGYPTQGEIYVKIVGLR